MEKENPWKTLKIRNVHETPWIRVEEHEVINPSGKPNLYGKVCFKNRAVGVVAIDDQQYITLVGQYRYTIDTYSWEIPLGGAPMAEELLDAMKRELKEETGLTAAQWTSLGKIHLSHSSTDEEGCLYMAQELSEGTPCLDETEQLVVKRIPIRDAIEMAMDGRITSVMSIAGILKAARVLNV